MLTLCSETVLTVRGHGRGGAAIHATSLLNSNGCRFSEALGDPIITGLINASVNDLILVFAFWRHTRLDGRPPSMDHT